jgi:hypothetical protein
MLDPRLYRAALLPILLALIVCAFSLGDQPRPIRTTLAPDAFSASRTLADLDAWARAFPQRRPGGAADEALAGRVAAAFRGLRSYRVSTSEVEAQTIDGDRRLTTVVARQEGAPGPGLVVVAHRDAAGSGARAELSGTAAMLELARVVSDGKLRRTITFVSTSGGSGGAGGARDLPRHLVGSTDAVLVLGDLGGEHVRRPFVVGWSSGQGLASAQLRRTVESAVRTEADTNPGGARAWTQWAHLAFPVAIGEQGPLVDAGLPAVLLSVSGERPPRADEPVLPERLQAFGRAALRSLVALDNGPRIVGASERGVVTMRKVLPAWAARLLVLSLLVAPLLVAIDGHARLRRRHERDGHVGPALAWIASAALPFLLALAFAAFLGWVGLIAAAPPLAVPGGAIGLGGTGVAALVAVLAVLALGWVVVRPALLRSSGVSARLRGPAGTIALLLAWTGLALVVWLFNPYAAALMVPGAHLLPLAVAPQVPLRRGLALALVALAAVPFALVDLTHAVQLHLGLGGFARFALLAVAGRMVGMGTWLVWSGVLACLVAAAALAWRGRPARSAQEPEVTVRGPLGYAGPGSLGGTESALRR